MPVSGFRQFGSTQQLPAVVVSKDDGSRVVPERRLYDPAGDRHLSEPGFKTSKASAIGKT